MAAERILPSTGTLKTFISFHLSLCVRVRACVCVFPHFCAAESQKSQKILAGIARLGQRRIDRPVDQDGHSSLVSDEHNSSRAVTREGKRKDRIGSKTLLTRLPMAVGVCCSVK